MSVLQVDIDRMYRKVECTEIPWDYYDQLIRSDLPYRICNNGVIIHGVLYKPVEELGTTNYRR